MSATRLRMPTAERREQIVRAALAILGERGLGALSTSVLAAACGVTTGALFRHFASIEEILDEVVRFAAAAVEATFPDASLPPQERLRALAAARVHLLQKEPGVAWLLRSDQAARALPPDGAARLGALAKRSRAFLLQALEEAAAAGEIRRDVGPAALLAIVTGTIHALAGPTGAQRAGSGLGAAAASVGPRAAPPAARTTTGAAPADAVLEALWRLLQPVPAAAAAAARPTGSKRTKSRGETPRRRP